MAEDKDNPNKEFDDEIIKTGLIPGDFYNQPRYIVEAVQKVVNSKLEMISMLTNEKRSLEDQVAELQNTIETLQRKDQERDAQLERIQKQIEKADVQSVSRANAITADDIIKSFVERLETLQERIDAKKVMADIFGESGAWIEARNKLTESGYFREERPHLPISYKGSNIVDLKFFDRTVYVTANEQQQLKLTLRNAVGCIDTQEDSSWFCLYAAYRYVKNKLGSKGGYTDFFTDIEALLPDVLTKINPDETGDKRYSRYTQMLGRVVGNWFVDDGKLPTLNNLLYHKVKCTKEQFDSYSLIIKNLWRDFKKLEDGIKQEKQAEL